MAGGITDGEFRDVVDPASYTYQESLGQVPNVIRLYNFRIYGVTGVPSAALGANGDYALRNDGGAATHLYFKAAGAWGAIA
jgi:hypothetical protein